MKLKKSTIVIIIAILAVGSLAGLYLFNKDEPDISDTPIISSQSGSGGTSKASSYTSAEVATHNSADDCWTIINDNVYDITDYIPRHPGGTEEIVAACGTDGTSLFTKRETADGVEIGSGTPHSDRAASQLENLKIGTLAN